MRRDHASLSVVATKRRRHGGCKACSRILWFCGAPLSTDGFAYILDRHVTTAACKVPSIKSKRKTPHVLRHSTAMNVLDATRGDIRKVSIWLGHADVKITEVYLRSNAAEKLKILEASTPPSIRRGTFSGVKDSLMTVLGGNWP